MQLHIGLPPPPHAALPPWIYLYYLFDLITQCVNWRTWLSTVGCGTVTFFSWNFDLITMTSCGGYQAESACIIWCGVLMGAARGKSHWEGCLPSAKLLRNLTPRPRLATGEKWYRPHRVMVTIEDKKDASGHRVNNSYIHKLSYICVLVFYQSHAEPPPHRTYTKQLQ